MTDQKLLNFLFSLDQNLKKSTEPTDGKIQFLVSTIMQTLNRYTTEKKVVITKNRCHWVNKEIKNLLKERDQARKKWVSSDEPKDREKYNSLRKEITSKIRKSKQAYFSRLPDQENSKTIFDTLKILKIQKETQQHVDLDADHFNYYFVTIGEKILSKNPKLQQRQRTNCFHKSFFKHSTNVLEVLSIVKTLKNSKSRDFDQITNMVLRLCLPVITEPLVDILDDCIKSHTFPQCFKIAKVLALQKRELGCPQKL